jgi:hypothetical protein
MIIERFDPLGNESYKYNIDSILEEELTWNTGLTYKSTKDYLPHISFQTLAHDTNIYNRKNGDPGGFCLAWCFLYLEMKIYYEEQITNQSSEFESMQVIKIINNYIINKFNKDFPNLKMDEQQNLYLAFIRYYAKGLDKEKNKLIKSYGLNISTIYHLDLDDKIHKKIIYNLNVDIKNINKI